MTLPTVAICAIVKQEARYITEWVKFHHLQGVPHFYLYHNANVGEDVETAEAMLRLSARFNITYMRWPGKSTLEKSVQLAAYDHCLQKAKEDWVACIDCDEFLYAPIVSNVPDETLPVVLDLYPENTGAVLVHWDLYGSNGHTEYSPELVIERFTKKAQWLDQHVKTIIKPKAYKATGKNVHRFILGEGFKTRTTPDIEVAWDSPWLYQNYPGLRNGKYLVLAHYVTKSKEEFRTRCARGRADIPTPKEFEPNWLAHDINEAESFYLRDMWAEKIKAL